VNPGTLTGDCSVCGPGTAVRRRPGRSDGFECKTKKRDGRRERGKDWPSRSPEKRRNEILKRKYGITSADYEAMRAKQEGRCAICTRESEKLVVDHCHATGVVRGLLCQLCNISLGYLEDDPYSAVSAAKYLMEVTRRNVG
jgi:hypothetical protein